MVNYKIQKSENGMHEIIETQTGYSVVQNLDAGQAKTTCRHMNFGGGFDGWTPSFFLAKTKFSYNESTFFV
jgi:hypothetical protein